MESILSSAKQAADMVIVDAPPFLVADAAILASRADGILLVVQPGKTPMDAAVSTLEQINRAGGRIIGVVMNRIPRNRPYYYGGYRHYTNHYKEGYSNYYEVYGYGPGTRGAKRKDGKSSEGWLLRGLLGKSKDIVRLEKADPDKK
jgi:Mrp family chromosome partitioning ATPase